MKKLTIFPHGDIIDKILTVVCWSFMIFFIITITYFLLTATIVELCYFLILMTILTIIYIMDKKEIV